MSVSAVAPTPFYQDPERLQIGLPQAASEDKAAEGSEGGKHLSMFANDDEPSFWDVLDVINPLQHIPVISNLYREMTGDQIGVGARLVGGTLFGGPLGLIASAVDCVVEESTGKDSGGHMLALFRDESGSAPTTQVAKAQTQQAQTQQAQTQQIQTQPAQTAGQAEVKAANAPVISLPMADAAAASKGPQPLVFSLEGGMQNAEPPAATAAPQAAVKSMPADPAALQALADPKAAANIRPLQSQGRNMPVPPRNATANAQPLPPLSVPVSNSGMRSNTPITGRAPNASMPVQRTPTAMPEANPQQAAAGGDWFSAAWGQALDKYQRANQRNEKASGGNAASTGADVD